MKSASDGGVAEYARVKAMTARAPKPIATACEPTDERNTVAMVKLTLE